MLQYALFFFVSILSGYVLFRFILFYAPRRMSVSERARCREIIDESRRQAIAIKNRQHQRGEEELTHSRSEEEESLRGQREDLQVVESDLDAQEESLRHEESRVTALAKKLAQSKEQVAAVKDRYVSAHEDLTKEQQQLQHALQTRCGEQTEQLRSQNVTQIVESRTVELQKNSQSDCL